jgi:hypothetical protein
MSKEKISEETRQLVANYSPKIQGIVYDLDGFLVNLGCVSYIKTIYIGYEIDGQMVAALYPYHKHVDLALAIPEDTIDPILTDASHLTWRSLPLLAMVRNTRDVAKAKKYSSLAAKQICSGFHKVNRDNEFFIRTKHERKAKRDSLRKKDS